MTTLTAFTIETRGMPPRVTGRAFDAHYKPRPVSQDLAAMAHLPLEDFAKLSAAYEATRELLGRRA